MKAGPRKKNKTRGIILPDFKLYQIAMIIKTIRHWQKNRYTDNWNRIKITCMWADHFDKGSKTHSGEKKLSLTNGDGKIGKPHAKE